MTDAQTELKPQGDLIFALDVGTRTVIGLLGEKLGDDGFKLLDYELEPHERRAMSDGQVEDISLTAKTVRTVCERLSKKTGIRLQKAAVAAAGRDLRTVRVKKQFDIAAKETITAEDIKLMETDAMQSAQKGLDKSGDGSELYYCVGYSAAGYELDGKSIINLLSHKGQTAGIELIVAFLPNMVVNGLYQTANDAGLKVSALTLEPIAAANLLLPYERRFLNIALADIGAGTSDIAVVRDYKIVGYEMATVAGDEITEKIMQEYFVDFDDAEAMKLQTGENIEYRDIFSFPQIAPRKEFMSKITDSVQTLATSIASAIKQVNGDMPGAAYLAGGGSMIEGLPEAVAEGLGVDKNRVQVARREMFRGVDIGNFQLGAQFVTPLGIALTAARGEGYDFSMILVNDHKVNIFDTHTVPLMELLRSAGYKLTDIMGRNGRSLMFYVNGQQKQIKGGIFTPAVIEVNDVVCSIDQTATQGDRVKFTPAINGESAKATLSELFGDMEDYIFRVNGEEVSTDYKIQSMDKIDAEHISQTAPTEIAEHQEHHEQHHEQHSAQPDIDDDDIDDTDEIENTDELDSTTDTTETIPVVEPKPIPIAESEEVAETLPEHISQPINTTAPPIAETSTPPVTETPPVAETSTPPVAETVEPVTKIVAETAQETEPIPTTVTDTIASLVSELVAENTPIAETETITKPVTENVAETETILVAEQVAIPEPKSTVKPESATEPVPELVKEIEYISTVTQWQKLITETVNEHIILYSSDLPPLSLLAE